MTKFPIASSSIINRQKANEIIQLIYEAGKILMHYYKKPNISFIKKKDNSPVCVADLESNNLICEALSRIFPGIPIISEESPFDNKFYDLFWLIDPLDGTRGFLNKNGDFVINIGLVNNNKPIAGFVYAPLSNELYYTIEDNVAIKDNFGPIHTHLKKELTVLVSASRIDHDEVTQYLKNYKVKNIIPGSSALKICLIAEGKADLYPRFGPTMEWDTAAGHAILNAAGGSINDIYGQNLSYGYVDKGYHNPAFIASATDSRHKS